MGSRPRILLLTRDGCHLCEQARTVIESVASAFDVPWRSLDVDSDPRLRSEYGDHVPVTFVDGQLISRWFLEPASLEVALSVEPPNQTLRR